MAKPPHLGSAIALLEYSSIAAGIEAGDAMVKRAPLEVIHAGTVHPGKYLLLIGGGVADVEEALDVTRAGRHLVDEMFLPDPHPSLAVALTGARSEPSGEALGIIETDTVAATIRAADAGLKGADVTLSQIFIADDLGGKAYLLFSGALSEVQAAVELGAGMVAADEAHCRVIAQLHDEMADNVSGDGRFASRLGTR